MPVPVSAEWLSLSQIAGGDMILLARMYIGDESAYVSLSSGKPSPALGTEKFLDILNADPFPEVAQELDMLEHTYSVQNLQLIIDNLEFEPGKRWSDLVEDTGLGAGADIGFYNRKIDIRCYLPGVTTFANCFPLLSNGIVKDIKHGRDETVIEVEDRTEIANVDVGTYLANSDAADTDQGLPEGSRGLTKPLPFGDHAFLRADDAKSKDTVSPVNDMTPCIYLGVDSSEKHHWLVADRVMNEILVAGNQAQLWGWESKLNRFVRLYNDGGDTLITVEQNTAAGCIISHEETPQYLDYVYGKATSVSSVGANTTDFADHARAVDKSLTLASKGSIDGNAVIGNYIRLSASFGPWESQAIDDALVNEIEVYWYGELTFDGAADTTYVRIDVSGHVLGPVTTSTNPVGGSYPETRLEDVIGDSGNASDKKLTIENNLILDLIAIKNFGGASVAYLEIYECYKAIRYQGDVLPLYFAGKGHEYDTWIDGRSTAENDPKRSGNFSETHEADDGSGDLVENFAGMIEAVLRNLATLATVDIDENTFNVASNDVPVASYKCTGVLSERTRARDILFSLCRDSRSWLWWQPDGTVKMKVMEDTYAASDRTIDDRDVIDLVFRRTSIRDIKTAVDLRYDLSRGKYMSATGISEDTDQQAKYNVTEQQSTLIHEAPNIGDSTTATNIRNFLLAFLKQPHNIVSGELGKEHLDLDVGDVVEFSDMAYKVHGETITANATRNGQTIYKYWWIFKVARSDVIRFEAIQLHDLS